MAKGDVITKFDGQKVTRMSELQQALNSKRPGDKATVTYIRHKKEISKTITLKNAQGTTKVIDKPTLTFSVDSSVLYKTILRNSLTSAMVLRY